MAYKRPEFIQKFTRKKWKFTALKQAESFERINCQSSPFSSSITASQKTGSFVSNNNKHIDSAIFRTMELLPGVGWQKLSERRAAVTDGTYFLLTVQFLVQISPWRHRQGPDELLELDWSILETTVSGKFQIGHLK